MLKRILSALAMIPLLIGAIIYPNPFLFQLLCWLCIGVALREYFSMVWPDLPKHFHYFATAIGQACAALWIIESGVSSLALSSVVVAAGFLFFSFQKDLKDAHNRLGHLTFGIFYIAGLGVHMALIRGLDHGMFWVFTTLAATWFNDTAAYFVGHKWGKHRLAPSLSPGKTWEGWVGGLFGSAIGVFGFWSFLPNPLDLPQVIGLVVLAAIFGPAGDLSESLLKRSIGVKDSGHVIPGHGGMLDRIDALLFTAPLFYYYAILMG